MSHTWTSWKKSIQIFEQCFPIRFCTELARIPHRLYMSLEYASMLVFAVWVSLSVVIKIPHSVHISAVNSQVYPMLLVSLFALIFCLPADWKGSSLLTTDRFVEACSFTPWSLIYPTSNLSAAAYKNIKLHTSKRSFFFYISYYGISPKQKVHMPTGHPLFWLCHSYLYLV